MVETREINALLHLIDDPDQEVFDSVCNRIISYGKPIIPNLEQLWEVTPDGLIQEKIELLIHRLHFRDLHENITTFAKADHLDLLEGSLLIARYHYPDMINTGIFQEIEKIKRNIWLELNSYLTALEQINIINRIIFNFYKFKGVEIAYQHPEEFLINKVLETKRGNPITLGILYQLLCGLLDIPVKAIQIPRQYLLAYFDNAYDYFSPRKANDHKILFYIDPMNGQVYAQQDVEKYFKKINVPPVPTYFKPMNHRRIFQFQLEEFAKCFNNSNDHYKNTELLQLAEVLRMP